MLAVIAWEAHFVGAVGYADDIALLAPCPSAMRTMLSVCEEYAVTHGLKFNPDKNLLCNLYASGRSLHLCIMIAYLLMEWI